MSKPLEKSSTLKEEHAALQNNTFLNLVCFTNPGADPDPAEQNQCGAGSTTLRLIQNVLHYLLASTPNHS
jgi:hypothetical protein